MLEEKRDEWFNAVKTDKDFGGDKFAENAEMAKRFIDKFGCDEMKTMLDETGYGNHPLLFKMMVRASKEFANDQVVRGNSTETQMSQADVLYPSAN